MTGYVGINRRKLPPGRTSKLLTCCRCRSRSSWTACMAYWVFLGKPGNGSKWFKMCKRKKSGHVKIDPAIFKHPSIRGRLSLELLNCLLVSAKKTPADFRIFVDVHYLWWGLVTLRVPMDLQGILASSVRASWFTSLSKLSETPISPTARGSLWNNWRNNCSMKGIKRFPNNISRQRCDFATFSIQLGLVLIIIRL